MPRINATMPNGQTGHFHSETATHYNEDTYYQGRNEVSRATGTPWDHETLYRTQHGRWVLNTWGDRQGTPEAWRYTDAATAKSWLLRNHHDAAVEQWFGEIEDEIGPDIEHPTTGTRTFADAMNDAMNDTYAAEAAAQRLTNPYNRTQSAAETDR